MSDNRTHEQTRTIEIPERTAGALARRVSETEFDSVDDYAAFALDRVVTELYRQQADSDDRLTDSDSNGRPAEESVETRLDSLGYL